MNYENIKKLVDNKLSTREIAKINECSQGNVKYWLRKYGLRTYRATNKISTPAERKRMGVIHVTKRRKKFRLMAIDYKGGKCIKCGYNKCMDALEFHHKNPLEKDFSFSKGYTTTWIRMQNELDKCILLCANCHREEHYNIRIGG